MAFSHMFRRPAVWNAFVICRYSHCKRPVRQKRPSSGDRQSQSCEAPKELMSPECKVAIITGGATGIGYSAACHLLKEGAKHVFINGPNEEEGESAVKQLTESFCADKVTFMCGDVNDESHFEDLFETACNAHGGVDILFNNAGVLNDSIWEEQVDINVKGVIRGTLLAFKYMGKNNGGNGGVVINSASIVGLQTLPGAPIYSSTKFAVVGTVLNFGADFHYKSTGVRVCAVCPGVTDTELISKAGERQLNSAWSKQAVKELSQLPKQPTAALGQGVVYIVRFGPSASVWVVEDNKILRVTIPDRHAISKLVTKLDCQ